MGQYTHLDAAGLRAWSSRALATATATAAMVDSFNVFPLPDLDTGSNVLLTLRGATGALAALPAYADTAEAARVLADGAVRAARGNSGLLISQVLLALAQTAASCPDARGLRPVELVAAYEAAAASTWAAVSRPVTGTLLSVARDAADAARENLEGGGPGHPPTLGDVAAAAALGAQESVVETSGLGHGPVDAGAAALMLLLTSLADTLTAPSGPDQHLPAGRGGLPAGEEQEGKDTFTPVAVQMLEDLAGAVSHVPAAVPRPGPARPGGPADGQGGGGAAVSTGEFEVMYLLEATTAQAAALRSRLETIGDSVGVVGTPDALGVGLFQVHVHTNAPRSALPRQGRARQVCVHHLQPTTPALTGAWDVAEPPLPAAAAAAGNVVSLERLAARRAAATRAGGTSLAGAGEGGTPPQRPGSVRQPAGGAASGREGSVTVGVVACTRVPGLIEVLARTGAVVVLDPQPEGVVRAVGDLAAPSVLVLPCDAAAADAAHEAARYLAARSLPVRVTAPGGQVTPDRPAGAGLPPQLIVADTDDDARVLAAAVALASRGRGEDVARLAAQASLAAMEVRTLALTGADAEPEAVAATVAQSLRGEDHLVTLVLGRDAPPDVAALTTAAVATHGVDTGPGLTTDPDAPETGADGPGGVDVTVYAGGQAAPDVLVAIQ